MSNKETKVILISALMCMLALSAYVFNGGKYFAAYSDGKEDLTDFVSKRGRNVPSNSGVASMKKLKVYVTGEVHSPGVYDVSADKRVSDVIKLAGGFTEAAKVEGVNLTKVIRDGMQIKVPALKKSEKRKELFLGEVKPRERSFKRPKFSTEYDEGSIFQGFVEEIKIPSDYRVCINTATFAELIVLPGIHDELARRIIEYRKTKPFITREDLLKVRGINRTILDKINNHIFL